MIFNDNNSPFFQEGLKLISSCPVCQNRYGQMEAKVLAEADESYLIYVKCRRCASSVVALVTAGIFGITSVGLITDLAGDEVVKFKETDKITADEVIAIHQFLTEDKGVLEKIIA